MNKTHGIFISYRRDGGDGAAGRVRDALAKRGYKVFFDVEDLKTGKFNEALLAEIDRCTDFVVILSAGALDRCVNDGDWVRLEIAHALKQKKNIVPVMGRNFHFPKELPADIDDLRHYNGIAASHDFFDASMDRLAAMLLSRPAFRRRIWLGTVGVTLLLALLLGWHFHASDDLPTPGPRPTDSKWSLTQADLDSPLRNFTQSILATLGQKQLLYDSRGSIRVSIGRVKNNTMYMIDTDFLVKKIKAELAASGRIEIPGTDPHMLEMRELASSQRGGKTPSTDRLYVLDVMITQSKEPTQTLFSIQGALSEVATGVEAWQGIVEFHKP